MGKLRLRFAQVKVVLLWLTVSVCCASASNTYALQLELAAQASVERDEIILADVTRMTPATPHLEDLRLGRSPAAGDSRTLDRTFIARALQRSGVNPESV